MSTRRGSIACSRPVDTQAVAWKKKAASWYTYRYGEYDGLAIDREDNGDWYVWAVTHTPCKQQCFTDDDDEHKCGKFKTLALAKAHALKHLAEIRANSLNRLSEEAKTRRQALIDAAKAICYVCADGAWTPPSLEHRTGLLKGYAHNVDGNPSFGCAATPIIDIMRTEGLL